jgi:hypothetical protein
MRKKQRNGGPVSFDGQWIIYVVAAAFGMAWYAGLLANSPPHMFPVLHPALEMVTVVGGSMVATHWVRLSVDDLRAAYWRGLAFPFLIVAASSLCSLVTLAIPLMLAEGPGAMLAGIFIIPPITMAFGASLLAMNYWWVFLFGTIQVLVIRRIVRALKERHTLSSAH